MRHVLLGSLIVCLAFAMPLGAEEEPARETGQSTVRATDENPMGPMTRLEVSFQGNTTLKQGLEAIQKAVPGKIQFVVGTGVGQIPIPDMAVHDARVLDVLNLLGTVIPELSIRVSFGPSYEPLREVVDQAFENPADLKNLGWDAQTCMIIVNLANYDRERELIRREMRMFRVGQILESSNTTVEDLATAVETVWGLGPQRRVASLRFHKQTNLLICYGSSEHILLAERVIERISGQDAPPSFVRAFQRFEKESATLKQRVTVLEAKLAALSK